MRFRTKLFVINLANIVGLTVLSIALVYDLQRLANLPAQEKSISLALETKASQLAKASEVELAAMNRDALTRLAAVHQADPDVAFVRIWAKDGAAVAGVGESPDLRQTTAAPAGQIFRPREDVVAVWRPVEIEGVRLGAVSLGYGFARIRAAQTRFILFGALVFIVALGALIASYYYAERLTRPVVAITQAFRRMADGDLRQPPVHIEAHDETAAMAKAFNEVLGNLRETATVATQVSEGNLKVAVPGKGDLANALRLMVQRQHALVRQIVEIVLELTSMVNELHANAEQQERGAVRQSSAVEENRRAMDSLLESARAIGETAQSVLGNAETTQQNSGLVAERIAVLVSHTQRISEILQAIREVANKSELLALNAALEGTKAGEVGRGFSLVARQMQRLAENVMSAVKDIKDLTTTIADASRATVLATEESTKLAADTTRSARQIAMNIQQQRTGTEQMTRAMDDVGLIARDATLASKQIVASAKDLTALSDRLQTLVRQFSTE
jgi:methyl-accepting chemotaxis protein